jgi:hypothetical protein
MEKAGHPHGGRSSVIVEGVSNVHCKRRDTPTTAASFVIVEGVSNAVAGP